MKTSPARRVPPRAGSLLPDGPDAGAAPPVSWRRWSADARCRSIGESAGIASAPRRQPRCRSCRRANRAILEAYAAGVNSGLDALARAAVRVPAAASDSGAVARRRQPARRARHVHHAAGRRRHVRVRPGNDARRPAAADVRVHGVARHRMGRAGRRRAIRGAADSRAGRLRPARAQRRQTAACTLAPRQCLRHLG